jgi:hypothetical protein
MLLIPPVWSACLSYDYLIFTLAVLDEAVIFRRE